MGLELTQTRDPRIIAFLGLLPALCALYMLVYSGLTEVLHTPCDLCFTKDETGHKGVKSISQKHQDLNQGIWIPKFTYHNSHQRQEETLENTPFE